MVTKMLEKAIEIEGLLRIIRDGQPLPETYSLLKVKTAELAELAKSIEEKSESVEKPNPAISETPEKPAIVDLDLSEEDDIMLTFEEGAEPESNEDVVIDIVQEIKIDGNQEIEIDGNQEIEIAGNQEEEADSIKEEKATPKKNNVSKSGMKLKSCFSLNDRFLYARELFDGNMKMFDSTLDFIEGIEDFSIIEDYFYNEMEWNPDNSAVSSFMEILRPNFNN